jgi:hypothetical protein
VDDEFSGTHLKYRRGRGCALKGCGGAADVVTAGGWEQSQPPNFLASIVTHAPEVIFADHWEGILPVDAASSSNRCK